jgi:hypothetical protein
MPATQPICNGKNSGRCEPGTLAQGDSYGANQTHRNEFARQVKEDDKDAKPAEKNATTKAKETIEEE